MDEQSVNGGGGALVEIETALNAFKPLHEREVADDNPIYGFGLDSAKYLEKTGDDIVEQAQALKDRLYDMAKEARDRAKEAATETNRFTKALVDMNKGAEAALAGFLAMCGKKQ